jgi:hypothetical protein
MGEKQLFGVSIFHEIALFIIIGLLKFNFEIY